MMATCQKTSETEFHHQGSHDDQSVKLLETDDYKEKDCNLLTKTVQFNTEKVEKIETL